VLVIARGGVCACAVFFGCAWSCRAWEEGVAARTSRLIADLGYGKIVVRSVSVELFDL
jgi:hypothetical protein